ncbi:MAG TPA: S8 family serine peptidase [Desulfuromonadales bacterium]|nr:S8 family serine peptidase [Desulfuromonadales bacterium]
MRIIAIIAHLLFVFTALPVFCEAASATNAPAYKEGELLVRFKNPLKASKSVTAQKSSIIRRFGTLPLHHVRIPTGVSVSEALEGFRNDPNVLYAEPNYIVRKATVPDDTRYAEQWNLPLISAPSAWDIFTGSRAAGSVIVAVLDTGIAYSHPDLTANLWHNSGEICGDGIDNDNNGIIDDCYGANFGGFTPGNPWDDDTADSHGTHVAGIIGAVGNNQIGTTGINWGARLMAVKFLHGPDGLGELADALRGVEYAIAQGAKIINMSFEVDEDTGSLRDAVTAAEKAGVLVITAAGNTGKNLDSIGVFPASIRSPINIAVAAATRTDTLAPYSDYGRHIVELAAPGGVTTGSANAILSTVWLDNGATLYRTTAGTSMAVPHVTGAAALIWNLFPLLTAEQVKARILNGVDRVSSFAEKTISGGRLNLEKGLSAADSPAVFDVLPYQLNWNGGVITVTGTNFGSSTGSITLDGVNLSANSWSATSITATVPQNARSGVVQVNGQGSGFPVTVVPLITLAATPSSGNAPLSVVLAATISTGATISKYEWDLGDGIFREIQGVTTSTSHVFSTAGVNIVRFRITDSTGASATETITVTVLEAGAAGGGGGGCFIATAAYGSYLHPSVQLLRNFRDHTLLTNAPGRAFVALYYRLSPPVAHFIAQHEIVRTLARWLLTPLVLMILHPLVMSIVMLLACTAALYCRSYLWHRMPLKQ